MVSKVIELKNLAKHCRLLYVEDDASIRKSMAEYLSKFFLEVVVATNGQAGLERYKEGNFELIVTDLSMPIMNGLEMLEAIKTLHSKPLVIVTSAHSESEYIAGAIKVGVEGYILKPFDFEQLNNELLKVMKKVYIYKKND